MFKKSSVSLISLIALLTAAPVAAGGRAVECYEPTYRPAVYDTVHENVMVSPGGSRIDYSPPIYGTRQRQIVISPARESYEIIPAITETRMRTVQVSAGGYGWEWRVIKGKRVLCKVWHKPRYGQVAERVIVQPARQRRVVIPAQIGYEAQRVLIQPEVRHVINTPPSYRTVSRRVMVEGESRGWKRVQIQRHCG
ncbi:hypothetical protein GA830_12405 [Mesorhizobium sp. NBSH29]|uniref:hypothetical protein n=1 Tax=Mesorhizobium sp. NBSH29 TaxID=2654249 RepID=UPI00189677C3|nr:hypothetical protein [Mesorhizobium sp. NBSH29]QPC87458.1 hypothetical protein GA830_12405 [Mesorhizobium sp. NBSH29]